MSVRGTCTVLAAVMVAALVCACGDQTDPTGPPPDDDRAWHPTPTSAVNLVPDGLPEARHARRDRESDYQNIPRNVVNVLPSGDLRFKGETYRLRGSEGERSLALRALEDTLETLAANPEWRDADGRCLVPLMFCAAREAPWDGMPELFLAALRPGVRIDRFQWAVNTGSAYEDWRHGVSLTAIPAEERGKIPLRIGFRSRRTENTTEVTLRIGDRTWSFGAGPTDYRSADFVDRANGIWAEAAAALVGTRARHGHALLELPEPAPGVTWGHVVTAIDLLLGEGFSVIDLPVQGWRFEMEGHTPPVPGVDDVSVRETIRRLEHDDVDVRREAVRTLERLGYELPMITRLALRANDRTWDGRGLADLLSDHPDLALPVLVDRMSYSSPVSRAQICRALGSPRENTRPAAAVLVVRALLDSYEDARLAAEVALASVDRVAHQAVIRHRKNDRRVLVDGSVARLDRDLLLGTGAPFEDGDARRWLLQALDADTKRFGPASILRVAALLASDSGSHGVVTKLYEEALGGATLEDEMWSILEDGGTVVVPLLLRAVTQRGPLCEQAPFSIGRIAVGDVETVRALLPFLGTDERGEAVAWAVGNLGVTEPFVLEAVGDALVERLVAGAPAVQTEGALLRLATSDAACEHLKALAEHEHPAVARAAIRILSLCDASRRDAVATCLDQLTEKRRPRTVRMALRRAKQLLAQDESVRLEERRARIAALAR